MGDVPATGTSFSAGMVSPPEPFDRGESRGADERSTYTGRGASGLQNDQYPSRAWLDGHEHADGDSDFFEGDFSVHGAAGDLEWVKREGGAGSGQLLRGCVRTFRSCSSSHLLSQVMLIPKSA